MPIPDFASEAVFPAFEALPIEDAAAADPPSYSPASEPPSYADAPSEPPSYSDSESRAGSAAAPTTSSSSTSTALAKAPALAPGASSHDAREEWFLVAQVKQNMTITKPTLVVVDRSGTEFAVTFEDRGIDLRPVKNGWTIVVPRAVRTQPKGGKQGFVRVPEGKGTGVKYVPGGLEKLGELGALVRGEGEGEGGGGGGVGVKGKCAGCGKTEAEAGGLKSCTGCGLWRYCGRECQVPDWKTHKVDCKILKGMVNAWGA
ncbi:hypothetical protein EsH8_V_000279 [Colletotrichum jinshuiense]